MTEQNLTIEEPAVTINDASSLKMPNDSHEVSLIEVLTQLAYRKWLIAKVMGVAILVGVTVALLLPIKYMATTQIMPPQQTPSLATMMMMSQLAGAGGSSMAALAAGGLGLRNPNDIYVGLLNSRPVADAIIRKYDLVKVYRAADMTATRKALADNTKIVSERSGIISISVIDKDKQRSADLANAYPEQLRILTQSLAVTEASQRRVFYEEQLQQAKDALVTAELAFQQVQQDKGLVELDAQSRAIILSLSALRAQVAAKQVEVQALRSYSTNRNPDEQLAENELASLQSEVARLEQRSRSSGFSELGLGDVPNAGIKYLNAQHEVLYRQALFDVLIKQYDAARLDEAKEAAIIQVVAPAIPPDRKDSPHRAIIVLLFTLLGFLGACAYLHLRINVLGRNGKMARLLFDFRSALITR